MFFQIAAIISNKKNKAVAEEVTVTLPITSNSSSITSNGEQLYT